MAAPLTDKEVIAGAPPAVTLDRVSKVFPNGHAAVNELDLEIAEGEFVVIVGPSGCGKSTALRMVAGLENVTGGTLKMGDRVVNDVRPRDRDVAMIFQSYALYPHMTVAGNIGFALKVGGTSRREIQSRVRSAAETLGLAEVLKRKPSELSGGQRQRVAMGRAIVREPSVFLMDEPLSNLDASLRVQMRAEISRIQRHLNVATLYVTHDQTEAMTMGDRIVVMRGGELQQCGPPQVVYDHPANVFVAAFIGSPAMNLFKARLDADLTLHIGSQSYALPASVRRSCPDLEQAAGDELVVGVRPEHFSVAAADYDGAAFVGEVDLVEALGSEQLVHFQCDTSNHLVTGTDMGQRDGVVGEKAGGAMARIDPRIPIATGERVQFELDLERLYMFDAVSGKAFEKAPAAKTAG
jgi:multiple sugar transport system ATP-binding protein